MEKKAFLLFTIKRKTVFEFHEISCGALTALIKVHRQLSLVMRIAVWYFICAREPFPIWLFHRKSSFRSCQIFFMSGRKLARKLLAHFRLRRSQRGENLVEPASSASNKIFGSWSERLWVALFKLRRMVDGTRGHKSRQWSWRSKYNKC